MNLSEYKYLWTTEKDDWVLVNTTFGYGIVNKTEQVVLSDLITLLSLARQLFL